MEKEDELFCVCRTKYDARFFMIECFSCKDWFHGKCIGITEQDAEQIEEYYCAQCQVKHHQKVKLKIFSSEFSHKPEDFELIEYESVKNFYQALDDRKFLDSSHVVTYIATGFVLNQESVYDNRFQRPLVIGKPDGLGLNVPSIESSKQLEVFLGSNYSVNIHDVLENEERMGKLFEWTDHFDNDEDSLDNISIIHQLDISATKLSKLIKPPRVFKQIDLIDLAWPKSDANEDFLFDRPKPSMFLSIGDATSYTDFSVGMAGATMWHHNITGSKTFYLIRPTEENLKIFESRCKINNLDNRFFGDVVDACYKLQTREHETIIIPGGWIYASYVNEKSISLCGELFDIFNIPSQITCYEMQKRLKSLNTIRFPHFEALVWCGAEKVLAMLTSQTFTYSKLGIANTAKALVPILRKWISKKEEHLHAQEIPPHINPTKLINSLSNGIGKFNRSLNQLVSPLKVRAPRTAPARHSKSPVITPPEPEVKEAKISIKLNKSLLFSNAAASTQNNSTEANKIKIPIKLRLPKNVLNEFPSPDVTPKISKSGRQRKRPKILSEYIDPTNSEELTSSSEPQIHKVDMSSTPLTTPFSEEERSDLVKIRQRLQKSSSKLHVQPTPAVASEPILPHPRTPVTGALQTSTRKIRQVYNEDSPDELDSESFLKRCKQDSFYVYPTIDSSVTRDTDTVKRDSLKLKVKLPVVQPSTPTHPSLPTPNPVTPSPLPGPTTTPRARRLPSSASSSKPKKGLATPKQRLGKLLKIDKSYMCR